MKTKKYSVGDVVFRHGDLLLKKTDRPVNKKGPTMAQAILLAGQNHNHELDGSFYLETVDGKQYLSVLGASRLDHKEHGSIMIAARPTQLELSQQVEYDHWLEESRKVVD